MGLKRLGNTSEHKSFQILDKVLRDTGLTVNRQSKLEDVIEVDGTTLDNQEKKTLRSASLDFVIYNQESLPEFAVEFDGPCHDSEERKRKSDIRKNRLCCAGGLRLLRIGDSFLTEYEKSSLLEYVVRRFVDWRNECDEVRKEESDIADYLASTEASEGDYDRIQDPQIMWDLEHPFPASLRIAETIYSTHGIISCQIDAEVHAKATAQPKYLIFEFNGSGSSPIGLYYQTVRRRYELRRMTQETTGTYHSERLHNLEVETSYCHNLPHVDLSGTDPTKPLFIFETVHGQDIPGISMHELADHFCDFLALDKLRVWVDKNLNSIS